MTFLDDPLTKLTTQLLSSVKRIHLICNMVRVLSLRLVYAFVIRLSKEGN